MAKKKVMLYIDEELYRKLRHKSIDEKKSASQIVEELIKEYLNK